MSRKLCVFLVILSCILALVVFFESKYHIWYETFDVSGLEFYKDEPIKTIIPHFDKSYIITESGKGYVVGGYDDTDDRRYRNSEFTFNVKLGGTPAPVLFFEGYIEELYLCTDKTALLIDANKNLYSLSDLKVEKLCENVLYAAKYEAEDVVFAINNSYEMINVNTGEVLLADIIDVGISKDKIFVLKSNGNLCEFKDGALSEPIFSSVKSFSVMDTSKNIFDGEKHILNDVQTYENPLFNVLTFEGELYAKGSYNLIYKGYRNEPDQLPHNLEEWTLIGENVQDFSLAGMGTVMKLANGCAYYGFDTTFAANSSVGYRVYEMDNVESVYATDWVIVINGDECSYFFGYKYDVLFDTKNNSHHILSGDPYVLER